MTVVNAADGIPTGLVPGVTNGDLDSRGGFELVSITFSLGRRDPDKVRSEIAPLLSALGSAVALPQKRQMVVIERAGLMGKIVDAIDSIPEPKP